MRMQLALSLALAIALFTAHLELSSGMGNVLIRPDCSGRRVLVPSNVLRFMVRPFHDRSFWRWRMLDLNFVVFAGAVIGGLHALTMLRDSARVPRPSVEHRIEGAG